MRAMPSILIVMLAAACGRDARPAAPAPGPTCEVAVKQMSVVTVAQLEAGGADPEMVEALQADAASLEPDLIRLCGEDAWSLALRTCIVATPPLEVGDRCDPLITSEQRRHVIELRDRQPGGEAAPAAP